MRLGFTFDRWLISAVLLMGCARVVRASDDSPIDFNRDVRPILSENCLQCHGPDAAARQADLRLDVRDSALEAREHGRAAIQPGAADASLIIERVSANDANERMPPAHTGKQLTSSQIETLRRWIDAGARYDKHWAFVAPMRPPVPWPDGAEWIENPIDAFVLSNLATLGMQPSASADDETYMRRVTLDLTGLPPTLGEIDAFMNDDSPRRVELLIDRLLASQHYGEHMARRWMDAARYADTHGYHYDNERFMWRWRQWVIAAFNDHKPYDQFTIEQLAGDLLPDATIEQRIATGFNRNHPITWEGGIIPEEYRTEYVIDRVNTTATVWMGLTVGCARCHDHKYDPISQQEFYRLFAFFNQVPEKGSDGVNGNAEPMIVTPDADVQKHLDELNRMIDERAAALENDNPQLDAAQQRWEAELRQRLVRQWHPLRALSATGRSGTTFVHEPDGAVRAEGPHPVTEVYEITAVTPLARIGAIRLEALGHDSLPQGGPGRASHANFLLGEFEIDAMPLAADGETVAVRWRAAHADYSQPNFHISKTVDGDPNTGWAVESPDKGTDRIAVFVPDGPFGFEGGTALRIRLRFESDYSQHAIGRLRLAVTPATAIGSHGQPAMLSNWKVSNPFSTDNGADAYDTAFAPESGADIDDPFDDAIRWTSKPDWVDGQTHVLQGSNCATYLARTIDVPTDRHMIFSLGSDDSVKMWVDGTAVLENPARRSVAADQEHVAIDLAAGRHSILLKVVNYSGKSGFYFDRRRDNSIEPPLETIAALQRDSQDREPRLRERLRNHFRSHHSDTWRADHAVLTGLRAEREAIRKTTPTVMVMSEVEMPRATFVLNRGRYDAPTTAVQAEVPAVLPALSVDAPRNRLTLARWLVDDAHPLTARVTVNRLWAEFFGRGLVETVDDFGSQGAMPDHPELLDWLATELIENQWNLQAIQKLIASSATYRQQAAIAAQRPDPNNRLLARGPRFRLDGETIRDVALAASGLLVHRVGGPSVKPYQPAGLWREIGDGMTAANFYEQSHGDDLYRRSLYTFWKRAMPPPNLATFDAPTRETTCVRRSRTNTPLQALVLMNDPTFVEAARALAQRTLIESGPGVDDRLIFAFRLTTGRRPDTRDISTLRDLLVSNRAAFDADPEGTTAFMQVGEFQRDAGLDPMELAAWTTVTSVLLNLDETVTKG
jgi:mono/diheme cytochrome c family protein